ncbi:pentatricopeptide repeat-containing protein, chloroplastic [Trifolium repens]|nr:pentatricopeptide repeat-containing protein, chloroplastic [Trifolium repens]
MVERSLSMREVERFMLLELVDGFELRFLCGKFIDFKMNIARNSDNGKLCNEFLLNSMIDIMTTISDFYEMLGKDITPDKGIFISVLLSCRRSGLVDEGKENFYKMTRNYNVEAECMFGSASHQQSDDIYTKWKKLNEKLKKDGYKPDTSSVHNDVEEEIKEKMLCDHSDRLELAFSLLNTGMETIRITKNLHVCGDCHTVMKFLSL